MLLRFNRQGMLLALGLAATVGPSIAYVNIFLNPGMRWLILMVLTSGLLLKRKMFIGLRGSAQVFMISLLFLAIVSTTWSPVPQLSGFKSFFLALVVLTYSSAGALWVRRSQRKNVFNVFWPFAILTLFAAFGGVVNTGAEVQINEQVTLYRGLTFNSNFLGMIVIATLPLPLWRILQSDVSQRERWLYYLLLTVLLYIQITTFARASYLGTAIIILFFFMGRGFGKLALWLMIAVLILVTLPSLFPAQTAEIIQKYVYKGADVTGSLLASRDFVWAASYEGAVQGGFLGLGYGVSYGYDDYSLGFGSSAYGREKANVFLAMVEETGAVGLALFLGVLLSLMLRGFTAARVSRDPKDRLLIFILVGYILALTVHAQFEAWMFSPGGALTPAFWTAVGMLTRVSFEIIGRERVQSCQPKITQRNISVS